MKIFIENKISKRCRISLTVDRSPCIQKIPLRLTLETVFPSFSVTIFLVYFLARLNGAAIDIFFNCHRFGEV